MLINPKTDWKKIDRFNPEELNRIENNINETLTLLKTINPDAEIQAVVTNRNYTSIEFKDSLNRIESNIKTLKDFFYEPIGWIPPKMNWEALDNFSFVDVNRLELDIKLLYELIQSVKSNLQYCGTFYAGDDTRIF